DRLAPGEMNSSSASGASSARSSSARAGASRLVGGVRPAGPEGREAADSVSSSSSSIKAAGRVGSSWSSIRAAGGGLSASSWLGPGLRPRDREGGERREEAIVIGEPILGVLGHHATDQAAEGLGDLGPDLADVGRRLDGVPAKFLDDASALERRRSRQQEIER